MKVDKIGTHIILVQTILRFYSKTKGKANFKNNILTKKEKTF
jgi:hypothetical protein